MYSTPIYYRRDTARLAITNRPLKWAIEATPTLHSVCLPSIYLIVNERYCLTVFGFGLSHDIPRLYPSIITLCQSCVNTPEKGIPLCKRKNWFHICSLPRNTVRQYLVYSVKLGRALFTIVFILFSHVHSSRNKVFLIRFNRLRDFNIPCSLVNKSIHLRKRSFCHTVRQYLT